MLQLTQNILIIVRIHKRPSYGFNLEVIQVDLLSKMTQVQFPSQKTRSPRSYANLKKMLCAITFCG